MAQNAVRDYLQEKLDKSRNIQALYHRFAYDKELEEYLQNKHFFEDTFNCRDKQSELEKLSQLQTIKDKVAPSL